MTPAGWTQDTLIGIGFAWMFGGLLLAALLAVLVRRAFGVVAALASACLLWGLGNLVVAALVLVQANWDTTVRQLPFARCEATAGAKALHTVFFMLPDERLVRMPAAAGPCPHADGPALLRLRKDALASAQPVLVGEWAEDEGQPRVVALVWGLFGAVGLLFGVVMLSPSPNPKRARVGGAKAKAGAAPAAVARWRVSIGDLLSGVGLLVFVAAFVGPWLLPGSSQRALQFGLLCGSTAFGIWFVAGLLAGQMNAAAALVLLIFSTALFGVAQLL